MAVTLLVNPYTFTAPTPVTFGRTTPGGAFDQAFADFRAGTKWTVTDTWSIDKMVAYLDGNGPGTGAQVAKAVIYAGDPSTAVMGALLGTSNEVAVADGQALAWVNFTFPAPVALTAGTYWLMLHLGAVHNTIRPSWDLSFANAASYIGDTYADGPATPGGTPGLQAGQFAFYASGTTGAPPGGPYAHIGADTLTLIDVSSDVKSGGSIVTVGGVNVTLGGVNVTIS